MVAFRRPCAKILKLSKSAEEATIWTNNVYYSRELRSVSDYKRPKHRASCKTFLPAHTPTDF